MRRLVVLPLIALAGLAGCALPGHVPSSVPAPNAGPAPLADCAPGEVTVRNDDPTTCDLNGDVNTLTIVLDVEGGDASWVAAEQELNDYGCGELTFDGRTATGHNCDF